MASDDTGFVEQELPTALDLARYAFGSRHDLINSART